MKKCPSCGVNYIIGNEELCMFCAKNKEAQTNLGIKPIENSTYVLKRGRVYGTRAQAIYDNCCLRLGWAAYERGNFGPQRKLYAIRADRERKRSVWFVAHSNFTDTMEEGEKWKNYIYGDYILETYAKGETPSQTDKYDRITFAKNRKGEYEFLGVYTVEEQTFSQRKYKLISAEFPIK